MGFSQKVKDIYSGYTNYLKADELPEYIKEQVMYRMELCKDCASKPFCPNCGCVSPVLFFSATKTDALEKWGPMVPEDQWTKFKLTDEYINLMNKIDETNRQSATGPGNEGDSRTEQQSEGDTIPSASGSED
jgi:hypothetical protein